MEMRMRAGKYRSNFIIHDRINTIAGPVQNVAHEI